jgi:hypothetical protein
VRHADGSVLAGQREQPVGGLLDKAVDQQRIEAPVALGPIRPHQVQSRAWHRIRRVAQHVQQQPTHLPVGAGVPLHRAGPALIGRPSGQEPGAAHPPRAHAAPRLTRGTVLECCPTSNVTLGIYPSYERHPLPRLRDAGVAITLGSDDPPYFGASIGGEYAVCSEWFGFDDEDLLDITRTAIEAAFCEDTLKDRLIRDSGIRV